MLATLVGDISNNFEKRLTKYVVYQLIIEKLFSLTARLYRIHYLNYFLGYLEVKISDSTLT